MGDIRAATNADTGVSTETRSERFRRVTTIHLKVGTNRRAGALPPPFQQYSEWVADTACGLTTPTTRVTKNIERVTCDGCKEHA